jgi:hypothetical protein
MNGTAARSLRLGVSLAGLVALGWVLTGQAAKPLQHGMPLATDWSHRHLVFSRPRTAEQAARLSKDPRYQQQLYRREQSLKLPDGRPASIAEISDFRRITLNGRQKKLHGDWSVNLGAGGNISPDSYPAKFTIHSDSASCGSDPNPDYVVFSTGLNANFSTIPSIVAYDNLYTGCGGTTPSVYWAYNTEGQILTSPVISRDGTQVAFVETFQGSFGALVLLKWAPGGTLDAPVTPTIAPNAAAYPACIAPCMVVIPLEDRSGATTQSTHSSVFYEYQNDTALVGDDSGYLHLFINVFLGTPIQIGPPGLFPVQLNPGSPSPLNSPIFDNGEGQHPLALVTDTAGFLYSVEDLVNNTLDIRQSGQLDFGSGLVEGPVEDSTLGVVYVFASSDGIPPCGSPTTPCTGVYKIPAGFADGDFGQEITVGESTDPALGQPNPFYIGGFDSAYYNSTDGTGNMYVCGNTGVNPTIYQIPIVASAFTGPNANPVVALTSNIRTPTCSSVTDLFNPNLPGGAAERAFFSVQSFASPTACTNGGCVMSVITTPWQASNTYAVGQKLLDNKIVNTFVNIEVATTAGASGATVPNWATPGQTTTDGAVVWVNQGPVSAGPLPGRLNNHRYLRAARVPDSNGNVEVVQSTTGTATSGGTTPVWNTTLGGLTVDGGVTWINAGTTPVAALPATGGTSGIIVDNIVAPATLTGASQVYFTTLGQGNCASSGTPGSCAVQASQSALQ